MANSNSSNISNNSSMFRGLHHNLSSSHSSIPLPGTSFQPNNSGNTSNVQFHSQLFQNHMHQYNQSPSFNSSNTVNNASTSSNSHISTTPVSLPAPAPVPGKSGVNLKTPESTKHSSMIASKSPGNNSDQMLTLVAKLWFEHNLESSLSSLEKDEHDKRIRDLRKQTEYIAETNWKYSSVDKYIGQT